MAFSDRTHSLFVIKIKESCVPVGLAQLVGTLHYICRGRGLNPGHSTIHLKVEFLAIRLFDKKKIVKVSDLF
jgi:hypothetical protein